MSGLVYSVGVPSSEVLEDSSAEDFTRFQPRASISNYKLSSEGGTF